MLNKTGNFLICQITLQFAKTDCNAQLADAKIRTTRSWIVSSTRNECDERELAAEYVRVTMQKLCK